MPRFYLILLTILMPACLLGSGKEQPNRCENGDTIAHAGDEILARLEHPAGDEILVMTAEGHLVTHDAEGGRELSRKRLDNDPRARTLSAGAFRLQGDLCALGDSLGLVRLFDVATGEALEVSLQHDAWVLAVAFSPSGEFLAASTPTRHVYIWSVGDGRDVRRIQVEDVVEGISFENDDTLRLTTYRETEHTVRVSPLRMELED